MTSFPFESTDGWMVHQPVVDGGVEPVHRITPAPPWIKGKESRCNEGSNNRSGVQQCARYMIGKKKPAALLIQGLPNSHVIFTSKYKMDDDVPLIFFILPFKQINCSMSFYPHLVNFY